MPPNVKSPEAEEIKSVNIFEKSASRRSAVEFRSQSDLSVPGMRCGIRSPREGQSSYKATFSFIMALKGQMHHQKDLGSK